MRIVKYGHACLIVEAGAQRVLIDPGIFSRDVPPHEIDAVLITHSHADHLDLDTVLKVIAANPEVLVYSDEQSAKLFQEAGVSICIAQPGQVLEVANGLTIEVVKGDHEIIHPDLDHPVNIGYIINGCLLHPGDSLIVPDRRIEAIAVPIGAPWLKAGEVIDYLRAVRPDVAIPIHEAVLAIPKMMHDLARNLGPSDTEYLELNVGQGFDLHFRQRFESPVAQS